jgi:hypothetical protein
VSLESPYFWVTYSFEGDIPGILLVTPYDLPRGGLSLGVVQTKDVSHVGSH